jgi:hypothetical protein
MAGISTHNAKKEPWQETFPPWLFSFPHQSRQQHCPYPISQVPLGFQPFLCSIVFFIVFISLTCLCDLSKANARNAVV